MRARNPDKSCRLPGGRIVRLGRRDAPGCPWSATRIGGYFVVQRKAPGCALETHHEPFELQSAVLDSEALAEALNAHAVRLAAATSTQGTSEAA